MAPIPVVLDTDIGSDVDDVLALLMVLASPELELVGVTASYGDTLLRARLAAQVCAWVGADVPIGAGPTSTLSGRPIWYAGHERSQLQPGPAASFEPRDAVDLLRTCAATYPGQLHVIAIGPLTTVATALRSDPLLAGRLGGLAMMGGRFDGEGSEHNIACDAVAAATVFASPVPTRVIGVDVTARTRIDTTRFAALAPGEGELDRYLREVLEQWVAFTGEPFSIPHDPLAVAMLTRPDSFDFELGSVAVEVKGASTGRTTFRRGKGQTHRVVGHRPEVSDHLVERIGAPQLRTAWRSP